MASDRLEWTNVKEALPEVKIDKGNYNGVLAYLKEGPEGGFQYIVSNTAFVRKHPELFLYWMYLPPVPEGGSKDEVHQED